MFVATRITYKPTGYTARAIKNEMHIIISYIESIRTISASS